MSELMYSMRFSLLLLALILLSSPFAKGIDLRRAMGRRLPPEMLERRLSTRAQSPEALSRSSLNDGILILLDQMAQEILQKYPPLSYDYVSVGTSPSLLIQVLRYRATQQGQSPHVIYLPLSLSDLPLHEERPDLTEHFRQAFTNHPRHGKRPLVFIDFVSSGRTLTHLALVLTELRTGYILTRPFVLSALYMSDDATIRPHLLQTITRWTGNTVTKDQIDFFAIPKALRFFFANRAFKQFSPFLSQRIHSRNTETLPITSVNPDEKQIEDSTYSRSFSLNEMHEHLRAYFASGGAQRSWRFCHQTHRMP